MDNGFLKSIQNSLATNWKEPYIKIALLICIIITPRSYLNKKKSPTPNVHSIEAFSPNITLFLSLNEKICGIKGLINLAGDSIPSNLVPSPHKCICRLFSRKRDLSRLFTFNFVVYFVNIIAE